MLLTMIVTFEYNYTYAGQCDHLPSLPNGNISYSFGGFPLRPYGTVATYTCNQGYYLSGNETRACNNSEWFGKMPTCKGIANCCIILPLNLHGSLLLLRTV